MEFYESRGQPRGSPGSILATPENPGVKFTAGVGVFANPTDYTDVVKMVCFLPGKEQISKSACVSMLSMYLSGFDSCFDSIRQILE